MGSRFNSNSTSKTKCHLIRDDTKERLTAQFNPTSIPYSRSVNFTEIKSPGMNYPLTQYSGGNAREFDIELFFYDRPYSGKIDRARKYLLGLLPPENNKSGFKKPPTFTFAYGYFVKKLVVTSLDIDDQWLDEDGHPIMTTFKLSVRQVSS